MTIHRVSPSARIPSATWLAASSLFVGLVVGAPSRAQGVADAPDGPGIAVAVDGPGIAVAADGPGIAVAVDGPGIAVAVDGPESDPIEAAAGLPPVVRFDLHRARLDIARGLPGRAEERLRGVIERVPAYPEAWFLLSRAEAQVGRQAEAAETARRAIEVLERLDERRRRAFDAAVFHENLGVLLEAIGDLEGAERAFRRAVTLAPERPVLHARLGSALLRRGSTEEAVTELEAAVESGASLAGAWRRLGQALLRLERFEDASRALARARELAPDDPDVAFQRAELHRLTGDEAALEDALADFERLSAERERRRAAREGVDQLLRQAVATLREDGCGEAVALLERALALPELAEVGYQRPRVLADLAHCREEAGRLDEAEDLLRAALVDDPESFVVHHELGTLLARSGRPHEGVRHLLDAAAANPFDPMVHVNLGLSWAALGRFNEALGELRRAVVLSPGDEGARQLLLDLEWAVGNAAQALALVELGGVEPPPGMLASGLVGGSGAGDASDAAFPGDGT